MPETNLSTEQLDTLIEAYCNRVVDEMDVKSMERMLYDLLLDSFSQSSQHDMEGLISSVYGEDYYNDLIEEVMAE